MFHEHSVGGFIGASYAARAAPDISSVANACYVIIMTDKYTFIPWKSKLIETNSLNILHGKVCNSISIISLYP